MGQMWGMGKGMGKFGGAPMMSYGMAPTKGFGKGGKAMSPQDERHKKNMDKIGKIEAERKVRVGGLPKDLSWGKLEKHFKELDCKPSMTEILSKGKGTAVLAYKTADEASTAIAVVNG